MIVRRIALENWLCFRGEHGVDLPAGLVAVVAEYEGQPGRSNMGGKTALLEAVAFALWGWHRKRLAEGVVTWGEDDCEAEVWLDGLKVRRARKRAGEPKVVASTEASTMHGRDADVEVSKRLGLSQEDAFSSIVFRQGEMTSFLDVTPARRSDLLASWLGQEHWQRCEARARAESQAARNESARLRAALAEVGDPAPDRAASLRERASARRVQVEGWEAELPAAQAAAEAERDEGRLRDALARFDVLKSRAAALKEGLARPVKRRPEGLRAAAAKVTLLREEQRKVDAALEGAWDGKCPVMGAACPVEVDVRRKLKDDPAELERKLAHLLVEGKRASEEWRELEQQDREAATDERERASAQVELGAALEEGRRLRADASRGRELPPSAPGGANPRASWAVLERLRGRVVEGNVEVASLERDARDAERRTARAAELRGQADAAAARGEVLAEAARAFGRSGIQGVEQDEARYELEQRACGVLEGTGLSVKFATAREGQKMEGACWRCGLAYRGQRDRKCPGCGAERNAAVTETLDVLVTEHDRDHDAGECSGGARALVGAAVRLAAAALLRSRRNSPISFLLVDEPFAALDRDNRELLARRLGPMAAAAGFAQVLVVTHDPDLADAAPHRVRITRGADGNSRVAVE